MTDQIIDATMACALHMDACRDHSLVAWVVMRDPPAYPEKFTGRLVTKLPSPYVLVTDSLAELHERLLPHLVRSGRQPVDPPEVVEIWLNTQASAQRRV